MWSILWDVYDNAADANDTLALGFTPIWNVLTAQQRNTPAFTTHLQLHHRAQGAERRQLHRHQYSRGRAKHQRQQYRPLWHERNPLADGGVRRTLHCPSIRWQPLAARPSCVRTVDDAGHHNKLGNRRFVRFTAQHDAQRHDHREFVQPEHDPDTDFRVYRNGLFVRSRQPIRRQPNESDDFLMRSRASTSSTCTTAPTAATPDDTEGTPGDYDLTVTVN